MAHDDRAYLEQRLKHSLEQANQAADASVAHVHRDFAAGYAAKLHSSDPSELQRVKTDRKSWRTEPSSC